MQWSAIVCTFQSIKGHSILFAIARCQLIIEVISNVTTYIGEVLQCIAHMYLRRAWRVHLLALKCRNVKCGMCRRKLIVLAGVYHVNVLCAFQHTSHKNHRVIIISENDRKHRKQHTAKALPLLLYSVIMNKQRDSDVKHAIECGQKVASETCGNIFTQVKYFP